MGNAQGKATGEFAGRRMPQNNNQVYLEGVRELYDTYIDLITFQDDYDNCCQTRINNLGDLLDDTFQYCYPHDTDQSDYCIDKDTFLSDEKVHCNKYKLAQDFSEITQSSDSYGVYSVSLSGKLVYLQMDDCQMTQTFDEVINYNDGGLITQISVQSAANETLICPSSQQPTTTQGHVEQPADDSYGPEPKLPPVVVDDYVTTGTNTAVMIDVLENDYDQDQPELSGKQALEIVDFSQGKKGRVEQKGNKLRYLPNEDECGSDTFTYWIHDLDDGLSNSAQVHIEIACPTAYGQELTTDYI